MDCNRSTVEAAVGIAEEGEAGNGSSITPRYVTSVTISRVSPFDVSKVLAKASLSYYTLEFHVELG